MTTARQQAREAALTAGPFTSLDSIERAVDAASDAWEQEVRHISDILNVQLVDEQVMATAILKAQLACGRLLGEW